MLFALLCKDKPGHLNVRMETRPTHVEYLNKLNAEGKLAIAGPFLDADGKPNGSLVIIEAEDLNAAKTIADNDPYAKTGLFASVEIRPWNWGIKNPEQK